jgi:hypothetical protein
MSFFFGIKNSLHDAAIFAHTESSLKQAATRTHHFSCALMSIDNIYKNFPQNIRGACIFEMMRF